MDNYFVLLMIHTFIIIYYTNKNHIIYNDTSTNVLSRYHQNMVINMDKNIFKLNSNKTCFMNIAINIINIVIHRK